MPSIPEQLDALTLRDDFNRADEDPMVQPNWTKLSWCNQTGKVGGAGLNECWTPSTGFVTGEDGCYWNPNAFVNPGVIAGPLSGVNFSVERWVALWAALDVEGHSGYRFRLVSLEKTPEGKHEWLLERVDIGVVTKLASGVITEGRGDEFALTVLEGVVTAWRDIGAGWKALEEVADATYTEGHAAIEGRGVEEHSWDNFYAGELEASKSAEVKPPPASATASAPSPTLAIIATPSAASATASLPTTEVAVGPMPSTTDNKRGLPLPFPSVLANPGRLGPPRFTALDRKTLGVD